MATAVIAPERGLEVHALSTPQILWRALWVLWICDALLLVALSYAGQAHRAALQTIGRDSAPSIIAAQAIKSSLANMDASAVRELLAPQGTSQASANQYVARRQQAATALIAAAQNITYGEAEHAPILAIQLGIGRYEAFLQRARDLREEHNGAFVAAYNQAAGVLENEILPAADKLDEANNKELEAAYSRQRQGSVAAKTGFVLAAMVLLVVLFFVQLFLYRKTHRVLNLPLFAATLLLFIFLFNRLDGLNANERDLRVAKEDAFASIHSLWRAWALAYSVDGDDARMLLDPARAADYQADLNNKQALIAKPPDGSNYESAGTNLGGYLGGELRNITFSGEGAAAQEAVHRFGSYMAAKSGARDKEFAQFDQSMEQLLKINQNEFDAAVSAGFETLSNFEWKAATVSTLIAMLCSLGLMQRIREYR